jgi:hypothetical protein
MFKSWITHYPETIHESVGWPSWTWPLPRLRAIAPDMWASRPLGCSAIRPRYRARIGLLRWCTPAGVPVEQAQSRSGPLDQLTKFFARFEERNSLRWHLDPSAGLWIASRAATPLARVEGAESPNLHLVAGSQCTDDAVQYRADDDVSLLQGQPNDLVNLLGQFGPRQPCQRPLHQQQRIPRGISRPEKRRGVTSGTRGSASLLQPDLVVDGLPQPLLAAQVSLRSLHRNVAQQELNLLQFAARRMT